MEREHYEDGDGRLISELFQEDKATLLSLPSIPFDTSLYTTARTDNTVSSKNTVIQPLLPSVKKLCDYTLLRQK